jgi:hypothetical protein
MTTHRKRQASPALAGADHRGEVEHGPAVTLHAVRMQLVPMRVQAVQGPKVDHAASVRR